MDTGGFWEVIEIARASARESQPFHEVLTDVLAARSEHEILDYQERFDEARRVLYRVECVGRRLPHWWRLLG